MPPYQTDKSLFNTDKEKLMMYVLDKYDVRYNSGKQSWQKIRCFNPFAHPGGDKNPSGSVNLGWGHYRCFSCDLAGDGYAILRELEGWGVKEVNAAFGGEPMNVDEGSAWL